MNEVFDPAKARAELVARCAVAGLDDGREVGLGRGE
jgi:hypothetical protein